MRHDPTTPMTSMTSMTDDPDTGRPETPRLRGELTRVELPQDMLLSVEAPARYAGGEFGAVEPLREEESSAHDPYLIALCFPDLYEIGMSNTAIKILYTLLNQMPGVRCERVFAPAPDFEEALRNSGTPLFTLESRIPLHQCDMIAFSVGYELSASNILNVLDLGGLALRRNDRSAAAPLVIAGGPALINPLPLAPFLDGVFIGEAEGVLPEIVSALADLVTGSAEGAEKRGAGEADEGGEDGQEGGTLPRTETAVLEENPHVWTAGAPKARRAVWQDFGRKALKIRFPVPNMKIVQDHATVEIMRGCPQGCRFCSAGIVYRPFRMKPYEVIEEEVEHLVYGLGYRTITLSSLSSGDYEDIYQVYVRLNRRFAGEHVAFALPSLRVNSMTLPLLEQINQVRKSGLTFAVETPGEAGQRALNKFVPLEHTLEILQEAERRGWRHAKLYFMIGLPVPEADPVEKILAYVDALREHTKLNFNVAVATFVPKPHTPFQWEPQLSEEQALEQIMYLKRELKHRRIKLGYQAPFHSVLEGIIARGDDTVADLIERAFRLGARLDAWEDYIDRELWRRAMADTSSVIPASLLGSRDPKSPLPWKGVKLGTATSVLKRERDRALQGELSPPCAPDCSERCGVCNPEVYARTLSSLQKPAAEGRGTSKTDDLAYGEGGGDAGGLRQEPPRGPAAASRIGQEPPGRPSRLPMILAFRKTGPSVYIAHLSLVNTFARALQRAGLPLAFTEGFHPKPRMEFTQPLSTGVASEDEYLRVWIRPESVHEMAQAQNLCEEISRQLPRGMAVHDAWIHAVETKEDRAALMSVYRGGEYRIERVARQPRHSEHHAEEESSSGTGLELEELAEGLASLPEVLSIGRSRVSDAAPEALQIRVDRSSGSGKGLTKILGEVLGDHPVRKGWSVTRIRSHARERERERGRESQGEGTPVSFRQRFPELAYSTIRDEKTGGRTGGKKDGTPGGGVGSVAATRATPAS